MKPPTDQVYFQTLLIAFHGNSNVAERSANGMILWSENECRYIGKACDGIVRAKVHRSHISFFIRFRCPPIRLSGSRTK